MFVWVRSDVGEALLAIDQIEWIHWRNNTREVQTHADVMLKSGKALRIYDFPIAPVLHGLKAGGVKVCPLQFTPVDGAQSVTLD